ncbi:MAG: hypothetical protein D6708_03725, partial [Candidatus Dadabacteria bacterium]
MAWTRSNRPGGRWPVSFLGLAWAALLAVALPFGGALVGFRMLGLVMALPGFGRAGAPAPSRILVVLFLTVFCTAALGAPMVAVPQ